MGQKDKYGEWDWQVIPTLTGGLNGGTNADMIDDTELSAATNVMIRGNELWNVPGYEAFNSSGAAISPRIGTIIGYMPFKDFGIDSSIVFTTLAAYIVTNAGNCQLVKSSTGAVTTLTAGAAVGATSVTVASAVGIAVGDYLNIGLGSGNDVVVSNVAGTTVTFAGYPLRVAVNNGDGVAEALQMVLSQYITYAADPYDSSIYVSSASGNVYKLDSAVVQFSSVTLTGITSPRLLEFYNSSLWAVEGDVRLWRSAIGASTDFTVAVGATSGYIDLLETPGEIVRIMAMDDYLLVFKVTSIIVVRFTNNPNKYYDADIVSYDIGIPGYYCAERAKDKFYVLSYTDLYVSDANFDFQSLRERVRTLLFDADVSAHTKASFRLRFASWLKQLWIFRPTTTTGALILDLEFNRVTVRQSHSTVQFIDMTELLNSGSGEARYAIHRDQASDTLLYKMEVDVTTDAGSATAWSIRTKRFSTPPYDVRLDAVALLLWSNDADIVVLDRNNLTILDMATRDFTNDLMQRRRFDGQIVSDNLMFQIAGTGKMRLGWFAIRASRESGE